jgi:hypothetical protein
MTKIDRQLDTRLDDDIRQSAAGIQCRLLVKHYPWQAIADDDGAERNCSGAENALYLVRLQPNGAIAIRARLLDASHGSLLCEIFPHLTSGPLVDDPHHVTFSRFALGPGSETLLETEAEAAALPGGRHRLVDFFLNAEPSAGRACGCNHSQAALVSDRLLAEILMPSDPPLDADELDSAFAELGNPPVQILRIEQDEAGLRRFHFAEAKLQFH